MCTSGAVATKRGPSIVSSVLSATYSSTTVGFCLVTSIFCFADLKVQLLLTVIQKLLVIPEVMRGRSQNREHNVITLQKTIVPCV